MSDSNRPTILGSALVMLILALVLSFIPTIGAFSAGLVGGRRARGVGRAVLAALVPSIASGLVAYWIASAFSDIPFLGLIASVGAGAVALVTSSSLIAGALVGGILAEDATRIEGQ